MSHDEDSQEFDTTGFDDDPRRADVESALSELPKPPLVKAGVLAVANVVAAVTGLNLSTDAWLDAALAAYAVLAPIAVGVWVHRKAKARPKHLAA